MKKQSSSDGVSNQTIVGGVLIGTALGAATAFLLSQKGKSLRKNLSKMCCNLSDQAQDMAQHLAEKSGEISHDFSEHFFNGDDHRSPARINWIIGGLAGGILGISALVFLTHDSTKDVRDTLLHNVNCLTKKTSKFAGNIGEAAHDVAENFEDHVQTWVKTAQKFIDSLNGCANEAVKKTKKVEEQVESTLDKVIDWTTFGIRLYQSLKK